MAYVILAEFRAREEVADEFLDLLTRHAHLSRTREVGCLVFDICQHTEEKALFLLYEVYRGEESYKHHRADPRHGSFMKNAEPMLKKRDGNVFWSRHVLIRHSP
jgi:quinol monooxygenase YgiN